MIENENNFEYFNVGKKNKKLGLEDAVKRAKRDLDKMVNPKVSLAVQIVQYA